LKDGTNGKLGVFILTEDGVRLSCSSFAEENLTECEFVRDIDARDL
jgi:hypothetical protein